MFLFHLASSYVLFVMWTEYGKIHKCYLEIKNLGKNEKTGRFQNMIALLYSLHDGTSVPGQGKLP